MKLDKERVLPIIKAALKEDIGKGDITTSTLVDKLTPAEASIITNQDCVACGIDIAEWALAQIDYSVRFKPNCSDGTFVGAGKEIAYIEGRKDAILRAERTMLNFMSFLSGIATRTKQFVDKARPYGVKIIDTRKTLPLLRYLEKYAVVIGGGSNHRMGLYDQVLIKDNHIKDHSKKISLKDMVETARKKNLKNTIIEIEVDSIAQLQDAIQGKPDIIMLDNMSPRDIKACMDVRRLAKHKPSFEVSGGITLDSIEEYAKTKVDMISIGSLTASVRSIDMSLEIV